MWSHKFCLNNSLTEVSWTFDPDRNKGHVIIPTDRCGDGPRGPGTCRKSQARQTGAHNGLSHVGLFSAALAFVGPEKSTGKD